MNAQQVLKRKDRQTVHSDWMTRFVVNIAGIKNAPEIVSQAAELRLFLIHSLWKLLMSCVMLWGF